jgi:hypothetical protein
MDEAAESVATFDLAGGRSSGVGRFGRQERESAVRALAVVMRRVDAEHPLEVAAAQDQQPVETFGADGANEALGVRVCLWRADRVRITLIPSLRKTSSKAAVNLLSRSWIRKCIRSNRPVKLRLRACCVTHAPVGLVVQSAKWTRRLSSSMKKRT